jgi:hypothetical protein
MRRRKLLVVLAGLAVVVAVGVVVLWPRQDRVTRANYDRIAEGMRLAEVEVILGPAGDYRTGLGESAFEGGCYWIDDVEGSWPAWSVLPSGSETGEMRKCAMWVNDTGIIGTTFDCSDAVLARSFYTRRKVEQSTLDHLLWHFKRQWHRWFPE